MKKIILISLLSLLFSACVKNATIKLPEPEQKLVVTCFLSPGTPITAVIRLSVPRFAYDTLQNSDVIDASVLIYDGSKSCVLAYNYNESMYTAQSADFAVVKGKTYRLTVTTPDGKYVNASTTVPTDSLEITSFDVLVKDSDATRIDYNAFAEVNDLAGQTNYVYSMFETEYGSPTYMNRDLLYYQGDVNHRIFDTDEGTGKSFYINNYKDAQIYTGDTLVHAAFYFHALNCSQEFYLYHKSVHNADNSGDNPFADPTLIYSNVVNGFGCFGAYIKSTVVKQIR